VQITILKILRPLLLLLTQCFVVQTLRFLSLTILLLNVEHNLNWLNFLITLGSYFGWRKWKEGCLTTNFFDAILGFHFPSRNYLILLLLECLWGNWPIVGVFCVLSNNVNDHSKIWPNFTLFWPIVTKNAIKMILDKPLWTKL
jgi:hypothetical protein